MNYHRNLYLDEESDFMPNLPYNSRSISFPDIVVDDEPQEFKKFKLKAWRTTGIDN